jgi:hypothetical protein
VDSLVQLKRAMVAHRVTRFFYKELAPNDNSKNQFYIGPNLDALNVLPVGDVVATHGSTGKPILKAAVRFAWLDSGGTPCPATDAQVIYYPQYPEVRLSSLIRGCEAAPASWLASRTSGRLLVLGTTREGDVLAYLAPPGSGLAAEVLAHPAGSPSGVFIELPLEGSGRDRLFAALRDAADREWVRSQRLTSGGVSVPCKGPNCGGFTLEALLGVLPNSVAGPDFAGWEIKQHGVTDFARPGSGTMTLMTPEPDGGVYASEGFETFVRRFGYPDTLGRVDRLNFGGRHEVGVVNARTGLTLALPGFDVERCLVADPMGGMELVDAHAEVAARWSFAKLINHWRTKHSLCAYVPSLKRDNLGIEYRFGYRVGLGQGTGFELLAAALARGDVFYDPGLKLEQASTPHPVAKRRNQIRAAFRNVANLYDVYETLDVRG